MKKIYFLGILIFYLFINSRCGKPSDFYSSEFLNTSEIAKPGMVDSLQVWPGHYRAQVRFIVPPDRRVNKLKVSYSSVVNPNPIITIVDIAEQDYGKYKEVIIDNLPEATFIVNVISYDKKGDSSNIVSGSGFIYGERYISALYNRIYQNKTTVNGIQQINFQNESGKPRDNSTFYPLQSTVITYPKIDGGSATIEISPFVNEVKVPDIADKGIITHYSLFRPVENAIDLFQSAPVSIDF